MAQRRIWSLTKMSFSFVFSLIGGSDYKLIYRHYATLYFVFCVDSSESELGILDLIQVKLSYSLFKEKKLASVFPSHSTLFNSYWRCDRIRLFNLIHCWICGNICRWNNHLQFSLTIKCLQQCFLVLATKIFQVHQNSCSPETNNSFDVV